MNPNGDEREKLKGDRDRAIVENARRQIEAAKLEAENTTRAPQSPMQSPDADAASGQLPDSFSGYDLVRQIHRGGQGVVYQAIQRTTKRKVAIKVLRDGPFAGPRDKARFEREVQILGQLSHPNIVGIHDSGVAAGNFFYVMDYISGQSLDVFMASRARSIEETLRLFAEICEAISAAHLRGVIHRDLKPGNIRIDQDGNPHILDFGLAKTVMGEATDGSHAQVMSMTGQFIGSAPWASPEQAEGIPGKIDVRTDVYSLGVILYQMLTGRFPYEVAGNIRDVLNNILSAVPIRPRTIRKQINDELETIVLRCLSKDRERRYQSAGELGRDIRHYLAGEPIEAKRDSSFYLIKKSLKRYRRHLITGAAFLCAILIVGGYFINRQARLDERRLIAEATKQSLRNAWDHIHDRRDVAAARRSLDSLLGAAANSPDAHLLRGALLELTALNARIEDKPNLTWNAIEEFQRAHVAAGGEPFLNGHSVRSSFSGRAGVVSASALRATANLILLSDWDPVRDSRSASADDALRLIAASNQFASDTGSAADEPWDSLPPTYDLLKDPLVQKKRKEESPADAKAQPERNAEITRLIRNKPNSLFPIDNQNLESRYVTELLFDDLIVLDQDLRHVPNPGLVKNLQQDQADPLRWTIELKPGACWNDDEPFTARDIEFSWNEFHGDGNGDHLASVKAEGVHTVHLMHKEVLNTALADMRIRLYPKHIFDCITATTKNKAKRLFVESMKTHPIGNGPYELDESSTADRIVLTRRDDKYVGEKPLIRRVIFEFDSDERSRSIKLSDGTADAVELKPDEFRWNINGTSFENHVTKVLHNKFEYDYICWNLRKGCLLSEPSLRKAIACAVDLAALRRTLFNDLYYSCNGIFQGQSFADSPNNPGLPFDPIRAGQMLDGAGWIMGQSGLVQVRKRNGRDLHFDLLVPREVPTVRLAALLIRDQLRNVGISVRIDERPYMECLGVLKEALGSASDVTFDACMAGVVRLGDPGDDALRWVSGGSKNFGAYCDPEIDKLFEDARSTLDPGREGPCYKEIQRRIYEDQPYLFLWQKPSLWAFNDRLRGVKFSNLGPALFYPGARAWWVAAESPD